MPIDSIFTKHLADEINDSLSSASIKRIYNISNNEFLFKFQNKQNLYISLNNECRANLTKIDYTFPLKPSNFTMLLRKYLNNFKVKEVTAFNKDRIIRMEYYGYNDLRDMTTYYLYIELFGRYSNLILTTDENIIIGSLKLINSESKTVLPNSKYAYEIYDQYIISNKVNISVEDALNTNITPCTNSKDFYHTNVFNTEITTYSSLSLLLDEFYFNITKQRRISYLTKECQKKIDSELKKLTNKIKLLNKDYTKNQNFDKYKNFGDLILTYGYQNKQLDELKCKSFEGEDVVIKLDEKLSVADNANKYYSKYSKLKRSLSFISEQIEITNQRIEYLDNLKYQLSVCDEHEIKQIYNEYSQVTNKKEVIQSKVLTITGDEYTILIGKNNLQNEEVTFKLSRKNDIWFHVKDLPGSHVLLKSDNPTDEQIEVAASYAAYYSKAKTFPKVEVTYTNVKNVKKISGSYPGHVSIINDQNTIIVEPTKKSAN